MGNDSSSKFENIRIDVLLNCNINLPNDYIKKLLGYNDVNENESRINFSDEEIIHYKLKWKFTFFRGALSSRRVNDYISAEERRKAAIVCFVDNIRSDQVRNFLKSIEYYSRIVLVTRENNIDCGGLEFSLNEESEIEMGDISVIKYNDEDPTNLLIELLKISRYFNQLEDDFIFPSFESEQNVAESIPARLNIFVVGQPGTGKSTFINKLLGEKQAYCLEGTSVTTKVIQYRHKNYPISIFDTPGFERSSDDTTTAETVTKTLNKFFFNLAQTKDKIHLVVFLVSLKFDRSIIEDDKIFLRVVLEKDLKLHILFTKYNKNDKEKCEEQRDVLLRDFRDFLKKEGKENFKFDCHMVKSTCFYKFINEKILL